MSDGFSRYLLRCEALQHPDELACKDVFDGLFRELVCLLCCAPTTARRSQDASGISALSVWWVKLGIHPERIQRGKPTQNGRHERIHRTLQEDIVKHGNVQQRMYLQQRVFDQFRHKYNTERPHEALKNEVPASLYVPSSKRYRARCVRRSTQQTGMSTSCAAMDRSACLAEIYSCRRSS